MSNTKSPDSGDDPPVADATAAAEEAPPENTTVTRKVANLRTVGVVAAVVIAVDQLTKVWAANELVDRTIDLFWTARFNLTRNYGSAFGLGSSLGRWVGVLVIIVVLFLVRYATSLSDRRMLVLLGAILGGAIGNLLDRLFRAEDGFLSGGVVDFIDFQWWPIFNIADVAVVCGAIGLMLLSLREPA